MTAKKSKILLNVLLTCSLIGNLVFGIAYFNQQRNNDQASIGLNSDNKRLPCSEVLEHDNFKKIFIEKNDSLYRKYFSGYFENDVSQSFLLVCAYHMVGGNEDERDFESVLVEMEQLYGKKPTLRWKKGDSKRANIDEILNSRSQMLSQE